MSLKNKIYFVAIVIAYFVAVFFAFAAAANAQEATGGAVDRGILIGPGKHDANLTSVQPWIMDGKLVGSVASYVYDDVTTHRPVDYWEFYDQDGDLLGFSWFDQLGLQRMAIDEWIAKHEGKLDRTFVVVIAGELI